MTLITGATGKAEATQTTVILTRTCLRNEKYFNGKPSKTGRSLVTAGGVGSLRFNRIRHYRVPHCPIINIRFAKQTAGVQNS